MSTGDTNYKYGQNYNRNLDLPDIAKRVKQQLKLDFPTAKWSITTGYKSINISLVAYTEPVFTTAFPYDSYPVTIQVRSDVGVRVAHGYDVALTPQGQSMLYRAVTLAESFNYSELRGNDHPGNADMGRDFLFLLSVYVGSYTRPFIVYQ